MSKPYYAFNEATEKVEIPTNGILSKTLHSDDKVKVVLFGFDKGQELSEHTASMPAILSFVRGTADLTLGTDKCQVGSGDWIYMEPNLAHSVYATEPMVMLLTLVKAAK